MWNVELSLFSKETTQHIDVETKLSTTDSPNFPGVSNQWNSIIDKIDHNRY